MRRIHLTVRIAVPLAALLALSACSAPEVAEAPRDTPSTAAPSAAVGEARTLLAAHGLEGKSGAEVVEALDQLDAQRPLPLAGSVRYDEVLLSDGTTEAALALDGDQFYLSMAPYETATHECYFHNLGTCQGELADVEVRVMITTDSGEVLIDEDATTYANGFVGFWIPKDVEGTVVVTKDGKRAESRFSSDAEGPTCLTTLQLL
ncbi:CueP family metal-binding protein [Tessaracoccus sp. MC1679]|uniref:CueP family metal-binding protein n=1 Tax=unclassified Tessaracoccus TaxID=2635419 RepID=UPI001603B6B0|nr:MULTISPECIES: CueP family metal-binding protein [unclassified Tessaracoccus]MBB1513279.1 CueP family metal-binding protein [Tessaracoccus sp. MC1627]MBB1517036.1 CueP family metal-binding protein [Tessaracoccus sp. MC1679]